MMDCFPLDEEIQTSIPFSNNSVVLAANSVLQQLLPLTDERNLQSVDVLLTSIWLCLRETKLRPEEKDSMVKGISAESESFKDTSSHDIFQTTTFCKNKTNDSVQDPVRLESRKKDRDKPNIVVKNIEITGKDGTLNIPGNADTRMKEMETSNKTTCTDDISNISESETSTLPLNESEREQVHVQTQTDPVRVISDQTGRTTEAVKKLPNDNKSVSSVTSFNCFVKTSVISVESDADIEKPKASVESHMLTENEIEVPPPILYPEETQRESCSKSNFAGSCSLPKESADKAETVGLMDIPDISISAVGSEALIEQEDSLVQETKPNSNSGKEPESGHNSVGKPDTILKTSDGKTFQISSNDGLTFEDSFIIEKVDSDDSDEEVNINSVEEPDSNQNTIAEEAQEVAGEGLKLNQIIVSDTNQTDLLGKKNSEESEGQTINNEKSYIHTKRPVSDTKALMNSSPYVGNCTDVTEKTTTKLDETAHMYNENSNTTAKNLGGIISSDNDSELKIINIAGGVTFYDDSEEAMGNDKSPDYAETKPDTSSYNPFSYSGYIPVQSSSTSLFSDVVFSSYSGVPGTYMSTDPRLTIQNCQQVFVPGNTSMNLESDPQGRLYPHVMNASHYENNQQSFPQGFQYFLMNTNNSNMLQPVPVEIKSDSKIIMPTKKYKPKKRAKSPEERQAASGDQQIKAYYNVRDPLTGKFVKTHDLPYVNNMYKSPKSSKSDGTVSVKEELSGYMFTDGKGHRQKAQNQYTSVGSSLSSGQPHENQPATYYTHYTDAKPTSTLKGQTLRQLKEQKKQVNSKLKAVLDEKRKAKQNLTEAELKRYKTLTAKLLKKLYAEKKKLTELEKKRTAELRARRLSEKEYVVRDTGSCVDSAGLSQEYTVVTIKGIIDYPSAHKKGSLGQGNVVVNQEEMPSQTTQPQTDSKKTMLKKYKKYRGRKPLMNQETVRPVKIVKGSVPSLTSKSKVKNTKQTAAAKKVFKIKKAKTNMIKNEADGKTNQKSKQKDGETSSNNTVLKAITPQLTKTETNKVTKINAGKDKVMVKKGKQKIHKVKASITKNRGNKRTKKALKQLIKARKQEEEGNVIMMHHGERGAKLAAQQKISAYNDSE